MLSMGACRDRQGTVLAPRSVIKNVTGGGKPIRRQEEAQWARGCGVEGMCRVFMGEGQESLEKQSPRSSESSLGSFQDVCWGRKATE